MISQEPLTCIHSRSERWISGQSLRHNSPSWPADMHIIRGGGLGGDVELGLGSSKPLAEPGLPARTDAKWSECARTGSPTQRAREQVGARLWLHFLTPSAGHA